MARLVRMDHTGHSTLAEWHPGDPVSTRAAETALRESLEQGYYAVVSEAPGSARQVQDLPPGVELVILRRPIAGG